MALLSQKQTLSPQQYEQKAMAVVGKGALATVLVCAGPIGWIGLAGVSIASAYGKASQQPHFPQPREWRQPGRNAPTTPTVP